MGKVGVCEYVLSWLYILPMAVFLVFTLIGGQWKQWYPLSYVLKTGVVAVLLIVLWSCYTRIRWTHGWLGVGAGILGTVQWIGMEQLFMSHDFFSWTRVSFESAEKFRENAFRPDEFFQSFGWMWAFILIRWAGSFLVVPVMEELFWRDFVWRTLASPSDFRLHEVGGIRSDGCLGRSIVVRDRSCSVVDGHRMGFADRMVVAQDP
ncbi:MAG: hypothetical protein KatS3mg104_1028 [Phycisphaerae bacterium]|nr:MAG: hypothetical protein KatS3mg104_1028 [Phycisphaerae bacterium]